MIILLVVLMTTLLEIYTAQGDELANTTNPGKGNDNVTTKAYSKTVSVATPPVIWIWISCGVVGMIIIAMIIIYIYRVTKKRTGDLNNVIVEHEDLNENLPQNVPSNVSSEKALPIKCENLKDESHKESNHTNIVISAKTVLLDNEKLSEKSLQDISSMVTEEETSLTQETKNSTISQDVFGKSSSGENRVVGSRMSIKSPQENVLSEVTTEKTSLFKSEPSKVKILQDSATLDRTIVAESEMSKIKSAKNISNATILEQSSHIDNEESIKNTPHNAPNRSQNNESTIATPEVTSQLENEKSKENNPHKIPITAFLQEMVAVSAIDVESEKSKRSSIQTFSPKVSLEGTQKEESNQGATRNLLNTTYVKDIVENQKPNRDLPNRTISIEDLEKTSNNFTNIKDTLADAECSEIKIISEELNPNLIPKFNCNKAEIEMQFASLDPETKKAHLQLLNKTVQKFKPKSMYLEPESTMFAENEITNDKSLQNVSNTGLVEEIFKSVTDSQTELNIAKFSNGELNSKQNDAKEIQFAPLNAETKKLHLQLLAKSVQKYKEISNSEHDLNKLLTEDDENPKHESLQSISNVTCRKKDLILENEKPKQDFTQASTPQKTLVPEQSTTEIETTYNGPKIPSVEKVLYCPTNSKKKNTDAKAVNTTRYSNNSTNRKQFSPLNPKSIKLHLQHMVKNIKNRRKSSVVDKSKKCVKNGGKNTALENQKPTEDFSLNPQSIDPPERTLILIDESKGESSQNVLNIHNTEEISSDPTNSLNEVEFHEESNSNPIPKRISKIAGHQFGSLILLETKKIHLQLLANTVQRFKQKNSGERETFVEESGLSKDNLKVQTIANPEDKVTVESEDLKKERTSLLEITSMGNDKLKTKLLQNVPDTNTSEKTSGPKKSINNLSDMLRNTITLKNASVVENEYLTRQSLQNVTSKDTSEETFNNSTDTNIELINKKTSIEVSPELISEQTANCDSKNKIKGIQFASLDPNTVKLHLQLLEKSVQKFKRKSSVDGKPIEVFKENDKKTEQIPSKTHSSTEMLDETIDVEKKQLEDDSRLKIASNNNSPVKTLLTLPQQVSLTTGTDNTIDTENSNGESCDSNTATVEEGPSTDDYGDQRNLFL